MSIESVKGILAQVDATVDRSNARDLPAKIDGKTMYGCLTSEALSAASTRALELQRFSDEQVARRFAAAHRTGLSVLRGLMATHSEHSEISQAGRAANGMANTAAKGEGAAALMSDSMENIQQLLGQLTQEVGVYASAEQEALDAAVAVAEEAAALAGHVNAYRASIGIEAEPTGQ